MTHGSWIMNKAIYLIAVHFIWYESEDIFAIFIFCHAICFNIQIFARKLKKMWHVKLKITIAYKHIWLKFLAWL